ncbi:MAG: hypothetical protein HON98_04135 [Chloroflexi bacterium]|jgi:transglutaminase-like putative cysteine protease|nr:hypothetical protein [Chloroflexota bacterium]MBT3671274.1 hypothetical protein [Chloroflexota bacterium]MBT4004334.1 hypothetical protein [Chloroflexota bacterium]MBT4304267.1 hypothetical protein [Chloroflexota bacterium]MBT4534286.1 hypothetical protein [Chloroflexota bacterium]
MIKEPPIKNQSRLWDSSAVILFIMALYITSRRLIITEWTDHLYIIRIVMLIAGISGLALGYSQFRTRTILLFGFVYGSFLITLQLGLTLGRGILWTERLTSLFGRLVSTAKDLSANAVISDPLLFLISMSILFWIIGVTAGYNLTRKANPWGLIVPAGITIVILHTYDFSIESRIWILAEFLFISLILLARVYYLENRRLWKLEKTQVPIYAALNMLPLTLGVIIVLVLTAWGAPAIAKAFDPAERAWEKLIEPWNEIRDEFERAFNSLRSPAVGFSDTYGDSLPLGQGNPQGETVVLTIESPLRPSPDMRFYWRARTYDYYNPTALGWEITLDEKQLFLPEGENFISVESSARWEGLFKVTVFKPLSILYTAPEPIWVSRTSNLFPRPLFEAAEKDIAFIQSENALLNGETYQFKASVANATIQDLSFASTEYPEWIIDKYLQIPENITERTRLLAESIAGELETPYEIAEAITHYLRNNIQYTDTVPPIPEDQDPIDWILFDLKQGFCNYFATAEVVMLRSLGIPARLGVGYSQGEFSYVIQESAGVEATPVIDPLNRQLEEAPLTGESYIVRQSDLHAWPEVFFPGIGWVEFEPTTNQDPLERREGDLAFISDSLLNSENDELNKIEDLPEDEPLLLKDFSDEGFLNGEADSQNIINSTSISIIIVVLLLIILFVVNQNSSETKYLTPIPVLIEKGLIRLNIQPPKFILRWSRSAQLSSLAQSYMEINKSLRRLDIPIGLESTPKERADVLATLLPRLSKPINDLLHQYQTGEYSMAEGDLKLAKSASQEIGKLTRRFWMQRIIFQARYFWRKNKIWKINQYDSGYFKK